MLKKSIIVVICLFIFFSKGLYAQSKDISSEIKRVRKELSQVQEERERVKNETQKDKKKFKGYRERTIKRMRVMRNEKDSIDNLVKTFEIKKDSLSSVIQGVEANIKEYKIVQDRLNQLLISATARLRETAEQFPPSISEKITSALILLNDELKNSAVGNVDAIGRLFTIVRDMSSTTSTIQIAQGSSPSPELRGMCYRIRIGTIYEAVVNTKGTRALLWNVHNKDNSDEWIVIKDAPQASKIIKAVNVREGKSLPELVTLPFNERSISSLDNENAFETEKIQEGSDEQTN